MIRFSESFFFLFLFSPFLISPKPALAVSTPTEVDSLIPSFTFYVIDQKDTSPIIGVTVFSPDYKYATITDTEGRVTLTNIDSNTILNFSFIGYTPQQKKVRQIISDKNFVLLKPDFRLVDSVIIWGRQDIFLENMPQLGSRTSRNEIQFTNAPSTVDALQLDGNAYIQKSQMGGGSPIVRGFEANKLLLVVDGVRMNNAIYRNGHLQNAISVDEAMLDGIEVIYGPGSLLYGSDALGGVIHFRTKSPQVLPACCPEENKFHHRLSSRFASANLEKTIHYDLEFSSKKWATFTSVSFTDFDDLRTGSNRNDQYPDFGKRLYYADRQNGRDVVVKNDNPNVQVGTGYNQFDLLQKIKFQPSILWNMELNLQYSTTSDIPRFDNLIETNGAPDDLRFAEWYYGPQNRFLSALKIKSFKETLLFDQSILIAAFQNIEEDRLRRRFGRSDLVFNKEDVQVFSFTGDFEKQLGLRKQHQISYGLEGNHNLVESEAGAENINTGEIAFTEPTRYPSGGSSMTSFGAYLLYNWQGPSNRLFLNAGVRYSLVNLKTNFSEDDPIEWPFNYTDGIETTNDALTWSLGGVYKFPQDLHLKASLSTAFRAPNIDDFGKVRPQGGFITVPNPELTPEKALSTELTLAKTFKFGRGNTSSLSLSGTGFYTSLTDAIVRINADLFGDTTIISEGDEVRVQTNINANAAYIWGWSFNLKLHLLQLWTLESGINYTKGREEIEGQDFPLAHIPPTYGKTSITYQRKKWRIRAMALYNGKKPIEEFAPDSSDNPELATPEGSLGWVTINVYSSFNITPKLRVQLAIENIADQHYRPFSSGVSAPGRNFIIGLYTGF